MRHLLHLLLCLSLALPAAAAGSVDVEASYLEETPENCWELSKHTGEYEWSYDNGTYRYEGSSQGYEGAGCTASSTTLSVRASDDEGTLAEAAVEGEDWSQENYSYSSESSGVWHDGDSANHYDRESHYRYSDGWSRTARASAAGVNATADRGCSDTWASDSQYHEDSYSWSWGNESYWYYTGEGQGEYEGASGCHETATVDADGRSASAGRTSGCESEGASRSERWADSSSTDEGYEAYSYQDVDSSECRDGAQADAFGEQAFVGTGSRCTSEYWHSGYGNWTAWYGYDEYRHDCFRGVLVEGPQGMNAEAGYYNAYRSSCEYEGDNETCWESSDFAVGGGAEWASNPAGPTDFHVRKYVPTWPLP